MKQDLSDVPTKSKLSNIAICLGTSGTKQVINASHTYTLQLHSQFQEEEVLFSCLKDIDQLEDVMMLHPVKISEDETVCNCETGR